MSAFMDGFVNAPLQPGFDRVQRHALLGVQFRDAVTGQAVGEGLRVTLRDRWRPQRVQALAANRSAIFALHAWPGMPGFQAAPSAETTSPAEPPRFQLQVQDTRGRYLPFSLQPEVPSPGLWSPPLQSPDAVNPGLRADLPPHVPLFSAATRTLPPQLASLRAELRRASRPKEPAAWARLQLWLGGSLLAQGQADEAGRALLLFALPRPREAGLGTSPAGQPPAFEWTVNLRGFWQAGLGAAEAPSYDAFFSQPAVTLLRAPAATPAQHQALPPLLLRAGETLMAQQAPESYVYVAD